MEKLKYIEILKEIYLERKSKNKSYNFKIFAKELCISPSFLSEILNEKKTISELMAHEIADRLGFSKSKKNYFVSLVIYAHSKSKIEKENAIAVINNYNTKLAETPTTNSSYFNGWYYFAILELTYITNFDFNVKSVAKYLGITEHETKYAIENLIKMNALNYNNGKYISNSNFTFTEDNIPSKNLRICQKELIKKAYSAIDEQSVNERYISSTVIAIPETNLLKAKKLIKDFHIKLMNELSSSSEKEKIYCLNISFFDLEKNNIK